MRIAFLFLALVFVSFNYPCRHKKPTNKYELIIKYNGSYCGGAKPSEQMLEEIESMRPLSNTTLKVFPIGKKKPVYKVKTDKNGIAKISLPDGEWEYTLTKDIGKEIMYINKKCSKAINQVYGTFTTGMSGLDEINVNFHFKCDPCDENSKKRQ